jgi:hypothetical protein
MSSQNLGVGIALISLAVALIGAVMSRRALRRSSYRTSADLLLEADRIFLDRPDLRPYFYDGVECSADDSEQRARVEAVAEFYLDVLETIWDHRNEFSRVDRASWREWIHDLLEWSPALRQVYTATPRWYPTITSLLDWEECTFAGEHRWVEGKRGPAGSGAAFRWKRAMRRLPLIGIFVSR